MLVMSSAEFPEQPYPFISPNIVVVGGGGGASVMAAGLAESLPYASVTALVCMSDDGGSTGALRSQFETPPVGDVRKCTSALSPNREAANIFEQRLKQSDTTETVAAFGGALLSSMGIHKEHPDYQRNYATMRATTELASKITHLHGHTFGNLVLTALTLERENISEAAEEAGRLLGLGDQRRVVPATNDPHQLFMYDGQHVIEGEGTIDTHAIAKPQEAHVWLSPSASISPAARKVVEEADALLVGPGSVFTSLLPVLSVSGMKNALQKMQGQMIAVANLVTQGHETPGWDVADYLKKLESYTKKSFDYVLYNTVHDALPDSEQPVLFNRARIEEHVGNRTVAIGTDLTDAHEITINPNDKLAHLRSRVHHNPYAVARVLDEEILSSPAAL